MKKTAIILGATGLTGGILLEKLLSDTSFTKIKLFSRSPFGIQNPKIEEYLIDLFQLKNETGTFKADVVFCCIGTTKAKTPDSETYRKIDYGIPVATAKLCKQNGIDTFIVISAMGADSNSRMFYNRTKGEMEQDVLAENIPNTYILQPSLIGGKRKEKRLGEQFAQLFMSVFGFLMPKKYKIIKPETIAKAMVVLANKDYDNSRIPSDKIKEISAEKL
jgi:uncharacterized protein YbjT (DUF2867 family)